METDVHALTGMAPSDGPAAPAPEAVWDGALAGLPVGTGWVPDPTAAWAASADVTRALLGDPARRRIEIAFARSRGSVLVGIFYADPSPAPVPGTSFRRFALPVLQASEVAESFRGCDPSLLRVLVHALGETQVYALADRIGGWIEDFDARPRPVLARDPFDSH